MSAEQSMTLSMPGRGSRRWWALLVAGVLVLGAAGCGTDSDGASSGDETTTEVPSDTKATDATEVEAMITDDGLDGLPDEVPAGLVKVTVDDQTTDQNTGGEVNFSLVDEGTTPEAFAEGFLPVFEGGPFPDFVQNNAGGTEGSTVVLAEGSYIVWADKAFDSEGTKTSDDLLPVAMTVGAGEDDAVLPDADGMVTTTDYQFDLDIPAGEATINFQNDSEEQFHHILLVDFGDNDPDVVEENIMAILESDGTDMPEGIDGSQIEFGAATSGVFGPGGSGTFNTDLVEGNTYVALCFISDVSGGAPHTIQHDMHEVFVP